jgi:tRNA A-37 threonylcarbamoyl transferase component Bud32
LDANTNQLRRITLKNAPPIMAEAVVRYLPNRREVIQGHWGNHNIYAKIFFGKNAKKYVERDRAGVQLLADANIPTPAVLFEGGVANSHGYALIFEAVAPSENLQTQWLSLSKNEQFDLAKSLVVAVAAHHNAGLVQTDLYLKNFLLSQGKIYTLDGDGVRAFDPLTQQTALKNVCVLFSKLDVLDLEVWLSSLLVLYQQSRHQPIDTNLNDIKRETFQYRKRMAEKYADQKVFRTCTDVNVISGQDFSAVSAEFTSLSLSQDTRQYDALVDANTALKAGNTCTVALINIKDVQLVIKRYNIKNVWHFLNRMWRPSRAAASWANAHRLIILGLKTAKPVAILEQRFLGFLRGKAYFISEYVDAPDMADFFKKTTNKKLRSEAVKQTVQLFYRLYLLNISHGDTKASNIKILSDGKPLLIDLDSMRQHQTNFFAKKSHVRDLKRFMLNWKDEPSLYNAFVKAFKVVYADHAPLHAAKILE